MDLGIKGKRALVCASSKGLGLGCAEALAEAGVNLVMNARGSEALEAATQKRLSQRQDEDLDPIPPFQCQVCRGKITQRNLISCQSRPNAASERDCGKIAVTQLTLFSLIQ